VQYQFDPSRAQNHAAVDLADSGPNTVEPFYTPGVASTAATSPEMSQYPRSAATTSDGGYGAQDLSRGPSSATSAGFAGRGTGMGQPPMPSIPDGYAAGAAGVAGGAAAGGLAAGGMSSKQREAYSEQQRFRVANQNQYGQSSGYNAPGGSGNVSPGSEPMSPGGTSMSGPVTVHEDAGAANDSEIPPT
jgi:hypothetical protein